MVADGLKGHNNLEKGEEDKRSNFEIDQERIMLLAQKTEKETRE